MAIGSYQHEGTFVDRRNLAAIDAMDSERNALSGSRALDPVRRYIGKFQEDKSVAKQIESRPSRSKPRMRRSCPRKYLLDLRKASKRRGAYDLPPLKWSSLKYDFRMEDKINGKEEAYG
jgi:hypothetical protein